MEGWEVVHASNPVCDWGVAELSALLTRVVLEVDAISVLILYVNMYMGGGLYIGGGGRTSKGH